MSFSGVCTILNALNLEKWGIKIHNCTLLLDLFAIPWFYRTHALVSKTSHEMNYY